MPKAPMTPRPTSSEDPYGYASIGKKYAAEEPAGTKSNAFEAKTDPGKKNAKAMFFNKLKKTKEEPKLQVAEHQVSNFDQVIENDKVVIEQKEQNQTNIESPKRPDYGFKIAVSAPLTKKPKLIIKVAREEEISALKEELEIVQAQLDEETDEASKEEWSKEVSRLTKALEVLTKEDQVAAEVIPEQVEKPEAGEQKHDLSSPDHLKTQASSEIDDRHSVEGEKVATKDILSPAPKKKGKSSLTQTH